MSTCSRCGHHHACPKCGHVSNEPWGGGRTSPLARWAADSAITNSELGAQLTLRAILDLLERHGLWQAREIVDDCGPVAIAAAFASEAWRMEEIPSVGDATEPTVNTSTTTQET